MDGTTNIQTPIITQADLSNVVRDTALLATLSISQWSGFKTDKSLVDELKARHGAQGNVGKVVKNQLAGADAQLKATQSAFAACRQRHYALTLPWPASGTSRLRGPRLLPNLLFDKYLGEMAALRKTALETLETFLSEYPTLVLQGQTNLGGMADQVYPSVEEVRNSFHISFTFDPIADRATAFTGLSDGMMHKLQATLAARQNSLTTAAQSAMWERVKEKVEHLVEQVRKVDEATVASSAGEETKVRFFESSIEHVQDLVTLLPGWNITGDPRVDEVVDSIKTMLDGLNRKSIKDSQGTRALAIGQGQSVLDRLSAWGVK